MTAPVDDETARDHVPPALLAARHASTDRVRQAIDAARKGLARANVDVPANGDARADA